MSAVEQEEPTRRDMLYIATGAMGVVAAGGVALPLVMQMWPDAGTQALATVEVDVSGIVEGQSITVMWQGKPIFIRNRTPEEIEEAKTVELSELPDPQTDEERTKPGSENLLVMVGICTHLGCVPLGQSGEFDGWFCPCHGSHYDTSGRIRKGPAPTNLPVPPYEFVSETTIQIG